MKKYLKILFGSKEDKQKEPVSTNQIVEVASEHVPGYFEVNDLLKELYLFFKLRVSNGVRFNCITTDTKLYLKADKEAVHQILHNFLSNAIKHNSEGEINFGYDHHENEVRFYVKGSNDTISDYNRDFISDCFNNPNKRDFGRGLGLRTCKRTLEKLNGEIGFDTDKGKGTTFWLSLTCQTYTSLEGVTPEVEKSIQGKAKLLIAEDNDTNFLLVQVILKNSPYELTRAVNGKEAVELCYDNEYDFIFMDIKMPVMDGVSAAEIIREFNAHIPIVALTANSSDLDRKIEINSGFNDAVIKPINKQMLNDMLTRYLG